MSATSSSADGQPQPVSASGSPPGVGATVQDRPELAVGGAFAGGLLLALILKRLAG